MVVSQLAPETTREELAEYFAAHHAKASRQTQRERQQPTPSERARVRSADVAGHVACGFGVGYLPAPLEALLPGATGYLPT